MQAQPYNILELQQYPIVYSGFLGGGSINQLLPRSIRDRFCGICGFQKGGYCGQGFLCGRCRWVSPVVGEFR